MARASKSTAPKGCCAHSSKFLSRVQTTDWASIVGESTVVRFLRVVDGEPSPAHGKVCVVYGSGECLLVLVVSAGAL